MTRLRVEGMTCDGCAATVRRVLSQVPGVAAVRVERTAQAADIDGDADPAALAAAVRAAGFGCRPTPNGC